MARNQKQAWDGKKAAMGAARKAHFAAGGTTATWLGRTNKFADKKFNANKKACRGRVQEG